MANIVTWTCAGSQILDKMTTTTIEKYLIAGRVNYPNKPQDLLWNCLSDMVVGLKHKANTNIDFSTLAPAAGQKRFSIVICLHRTTS